jgi:hypothetical protein
MTTQAKTMKRLMSVCATTIALSALAAMPARAQGTQDKPAPLPTVPSKVDVVISRFQGEKKVSSQPYVLMPSSDPRGNGYAQVRIGVDVPVGVTTTTRLPEGGREGQSTTKPSYQNVGTNIDCRVTPLAEGKYSVYVSVTDSSIFTPDASSGGRSMETTTPAIRTFQASNTMTMRDGQTMLLTTATDKVTGDLLKIEVTFSLVK